MFLFTRSNYLPFFKNSDTQINDEAINMHISFKSTGSALISKNCFLKHARTLAILLEQPSKSLIKIFLHDHRNIQIYIYKQ